MKPGTCLTQEEFLVKVRAVHGDRYSYTKVRYSKSNRKIRVVCKEHGAFDQIAADHLKGSGCPECARLSHVRWSDQDDQFLRDNYVEHGTKYCATILSKTSSAVRSRTCYLGLRRIALRLRSYEDIPGRMWSVLLGNAKKRGFEVKIDQAHIWELYEKQGRRCALTGWSVVFQKKGEITASVDRIDSSKGYVPGNVQIVHKLVNCSKVNYDELDFYALCKAVHEHRRDSFERPERYQVDDFLNDTVHEATRRVLGRPGPAQDVSDEAIFGDLDAKSCEV